MIRDEILLIIEVTDGSGKINCEEPIKYLMKENKITKFQISIYVMCDFGDCKIYSISVAWIENDKLELVVGKICIY